MFIIFDNFLHNLFTPKILASFSKDIVANIEEVYISLNICVSGAYWS